ncbi:MAG: HAMP domain-containing protein [Treponema sp.]|nr:HAMP domain-containing protein [Treponema sp.]
MANTQPKPRVLFPIGAKLVIIITILLLVSLGAVTFLVSYLSTQDVQLTAEDNNFTVNQRAGSQAEGSFKSIQTGILLYLEMIDRISAVNRDSGMEHRFFSHNKNIAAIGTEYFAAGGETTAARNLSRITTFIPNEPFLLANNINIDEVRNYFDSTLSSNAIRVSPDRMRLFNSAGVCQLSLITLVFVREARMGEEIVKVLFFPDDLSDSFGTGTNTSFLINGSNDVLIHPDNDLVLGGANFSSLPIVKAMQQEGDNNRRQIPFDGDEGVRYFGAYYRLAGTDTAVITTIPHNVVFEAIQRITRQNIFLMGVVLFMAILFIWFFSKTISTPVRTLADAALRIEGGDFEMELKSKTRDELGLLTESFSKMTSALKIFGRFTNKDIAVRAMRGEIKPGGLPRHATIFFSDIRNFTEKSESFTKTFGDDASNRIVLWLNEYFTQMIDCVENTGGVVDKFIGDAVMAHWGTAFTAGSPAEDAFNCVKAALMMRQALLDLNAKRKKDDPGDPVIHIGCGINTGVVTVGQIGSDKRMEYTAIGDPVNLASRTEGLNKPMGTDILITEETWELTGDKFITEEMSTVSVKGKEKPVRIFAVVNLKDAGGPQTLKEVRSLLGISPQDRRGTDANRRKVDINAKEKKYKILGN